MNATTSGVTTSTDGVPIAWSRQGEGPTIVMISCVMASRTTGPQLSLPAALAQQHTVVTYDRRGTGESGTAAAYSVEREFDDLAQIMEMAGPGAAVYGFSSGATLALLAAAHGVEISQLLLLEPPLIPDPSLGHLAEARRRLSLDRADARRWFDESVTGIPTEVRAQFPPFSDSDLADAPAMLHELTFLPGTDAAQFADLRQPTLLMASERTASYLIGCVQALAAAIPDSQLSLLPGVWHGVDEDDLVTAIQNFVIDREKHGAVKVSE
ncbi:MAG: alpha/beta hydrolase [Ornithinibacter sp.]